MPSMSGAFDYGSRRLQARSPNISVASRKLAMPWTSACDRRRSTGHSRQAKIGFLCVFCHGRGSGQRKQPFGRVAAIERNVFARRS